MERPLPLDDPETTKYVLMPAYFVVLMANFILVIPV
jgi:hypothetical protein